MTMRWHEFLDKQAQSRPHAPALRETGGLEWSYGQLDGACRDFREYLERSGAKAGDRVLVLLENSASAVSVLFACARAGLCVIPVNARMTGTEVNRIITHATPAFVVFCTRDSPDARNHATVMNANPVTGAFGELCVEKISPGQGDTPRDVAALLYTTGTTGAPKGVMLTHEGLVFAGKAARDFRGLTGDSLVYGAAPMAHVIGLASMLTATICAGACVWLEPRFSAQRLYQALQQGVTHLPAVPQMHALLMQYAHEKGLTGLSGSALEYVSSGGAPLDPAWKRKAEAFYGLPLQNGYGMTETTAAASITSSAIGDPDISVGPPLRGVEIRIDSDVPAGNGADTGEVLVRGPIVMKGYFRNPEETAKTLCEDGWLRSGDIGKFDDKGNLHILGRCKELIIHGGFNVYPPEVEAALNDHPQVIQSAVIGRMVAGDEEVLAFVQGAPGDLPDPGALLRFVAGRLAGYKRPSQVVVATGLPAAATGKILKHKLLEHFVDELDSP